LQADGLLDPRRKRPLPRVPRVVGLATSPTGAALQDFLKVSRGRFPAARVLLAGCTVQGPAAAASVLRAVDLLVEDGRAEVIVVTRGGGSKLDLMPFQDEQLARFLALCPVPVVSAVGHEIDTTIADLVADVVAPTPSAAALAVLPDRAAMMQRVDEAELRLTEAARRAIARSRLALERLSARCRHPTVRLAQGRERLARLEHRLGVGMGRALARASERHRSADLRLRGVDPLAVVQRGYALVTHEGRPVRDGTDVPLGAEVDVAVSGRGFVARVVRYHPPRGEPCS
jgi:exodeoxyribonuclease VII large subunit